MAVSYTADQLNTVSKLQQISASILDLIAQAKLITQEAVDKGYTPGTATTGITDAILQTAVGTSPAPAPALVATDITAAVIAITSLDTTLAAATRAGYKALEKMRP